MVYIFNFLRTEYAMELAELKVTLPEIKDIPKIKFMDAKNLIQEVYKRPYRDPNDLEPDEEKLIGKYFMEKYGSPFVFVTHYPTKKRPFYTMDDPENPEFTLSFDLLLNGTEVTTGGQRIHDYNEQVAKMQSRDMDINDFSDYLMMHKCGMPPHGGLGLGLERLVMRILNLDNIKYATAFPRDLNRLNP
jgi:nondiscriminating aspartyl-tRNA synthetase